MIVFYTLNMYTIIWKKLTGLQKHNLYERISRRFLSGHTGHYLNYSLNINAQSVHLVPSFHSRPLTPLRSIFIALYRTLIPFNRHLIAFLLFILS
jgi:hypothetical protein